MPQTFGKPKIDKMAAPILSRVTLKTCKILLTLIVVLNVGYFSLYHRGDTSEPVISNALSEVGLPESGLPEGGLSEGSTFDQQIEGLFSQVEQDKNRYWLAHTGLTETDIDVQIKAFLRNDLPISWINKKQLWYDPRFTLAMISSELKARFLRTKPVKKARNSKIDLNLIDRPVLPFNWADWMDLTVLNDDLKKPRDERLSCQEIADNTNNNPDPAYFCKDNQAFSKEKGFQDFISNLGYNSAEQLPGFIIHGHSDHEDRPFNDFRIWEAKSYAMTHLPSPYRVIILNGDENGGTIEFDVDQKNNKRIIATDLVENFLKNHGLDPDKIDEGTVLQLSHLIEFESLKKEVTPRHLTKEQDVLGMYEKTRKQSDPRASRDVILNEDLFAPVAIKDEIAAFEAKGSTPIEKLDRFERNYYDGLKQCSKFDDSNEPTFFKMATIRIDDDKNRDREWGWHYDWRFFNGALNYDREGWNEQELIHRTNIILDRLLRNWNRFAEEKGIVSWIMHGPLLSWYWDGLMFPFDLDIDIQMPMSELTRLSREYNQTLVVEDPAEGYGKFLIEVGTYIHNRGISVNSNHIDARFIDVDSGIYIDITGLSRSEAEVPSEYKDNYLVNIEKPEKDASVEIYNDRRKHFYKLEQLSPLRYSVMGGVPVYVPSTITDRLVFEYSEGLSAYEFNNWYYVSRLNLWITKAQLVTAFNSEDIKGDNGDVDKTKLLAATASMTDDQVLKLLEDDDILVEYYLTKALTDTHEIEKQYLFDSLGKDNHQLDTDTNLREEYNKLTSTFKMSKPLRKALFDFEALERMKHHHD